MDQKINYETQDGHFFPYPSNVCELFNALKEFNTGDLSPGVSSILSNLSMNKISFASEMSKKQANELKSKCVFIQNSSLRSSLCDILSQIEELKLPKLNMKSQSTVQIDSDNEFDYYEDQERKNNFLIDSELELIEVNDSLMINSTPTECNYFQFF